MLKADMQPLPVEVISHGFEIPIPASISEPLALTSNVLSDA